MSYDLMVFEAEAAPRDRPSFMAWYWQQTEWSEPHSYDNPEVSAPPLQSWFREMIESFPPMNGPLATDDVDSPRVTDYSVGRQVIYAAFAWSMAEEAHGLMRQLAIKHGVGFFDVSADEGEILFPGDAGESAREKPWWKFW